jgi:hypothetical protein
VIRRRIAAFVLFSAACSAPPPNSPGGPHAPQEAQPVSSAPRPKSARAPARLARKYTGQATPTLVVNNRFPIGQHVFLDSKLLGKVGTSSTTTFEVPAGVHTLTSADSADQDDNPVSITERFETGFSYSYDIAPE